MNTILKLYKSTIIPSLLYGCETWIPTEIDQKKLLNIQLSIIRKIVKASNSTPKISLYGEIWGNWRTTNRFHKRQNANHVT